MAILCLASQTAIRTRVLSPPSLPYLSLSPLPLTVVSLLLLFPTFFVLIPIPVSISASYPPFSSPFAPSLILCLPLFFVFFLPAQFSVAVMSAPAETTAAPVEEVKPTETPAPAAEETPAAPAAEEAPKAEEAAAAEPVCFLLNPPREHSLTSFTGSPQGRDC